MIPQIAKALSSGFTSKQVVDYILKKFPEHSDAIKKALTAGFTVDQVMKYLGGGKKALSQEQSIPEETTEYGRTRTRDISQRENINKTAGQAAALAAGSLAAPMVGAALKHALPTALTPMIPSLTGSLQKQTQQPQSSQPPINIPAIQQSEQPIQPNIPQPVESLQPKGISDKLWESVEGGRLTDKDPNVSAFLKVANSLRKTRGLSTKEQFDNLYKVFENKREMGLEGPELARELFAEWEQMKGSNGETAQNQSQIGKNLEQPGQKLDEVKEIERPKIEKNSVVSSPNGVGEVKEIRNGKAIVDVDGKLHKVDEDELISSPLPEKELADLYDDLIQGVEKETGEDVSRMVDWAGYDPNTGKLAFLPHDGGLYTYSNLSKDEVDQLTSVLSTRKTSGSNFIGAWSAKSKSPIGAAMSALIKKLQLERGGKGNEYEEKFETVYKAFEPAIKAAKKKKKK